VGGAAEALAVVEAALAVSAAAVPAAEERVVAGNSEE